MRGEPWRYLSTGQAPQEDNLKLLLQSLSQQFLRILIYCQINKPLV